jgi:hypothetical protein
MPMPMQGRHGTIWPMAPGMAMRLHGDKIGRSEKCRPTPNISRMTPISASCDESPACRHETRRVGTDQDSGDEITNQRRQPQPVRDVAEAEGEHEADGNGGDQRRFVMHVRGP